MNLKELAEKLNLKLLNEVTIIDRDIRSGYTSDLLSDVMGNAEEDCIWITIQKHPNIVAVASLNEIGAIVLVAGAEPDDETIEKATENDIPIFKTEKRGFEISGEIYNLLK